MFSLLVTITVVAAVSASPLSHKASHNFRSGRIIGGENAVIETYPYQISIEHERVHICGGSIISANYVLTAGHCVFELSNKFRIRAGSSLVGKGGSLHKVNKVVLHEEYYETEDEVPINDVAILRVEEPFEFDDTRQPINLYQAGEEALPGLMGVITGWGDTDFGSPDQLQTVDVPIVTKELCNTVYQPYGGLPERQICAGYYEEGGKDSCQGDSGGPLAINGRLAGITSWAYGCAEPKYPGVYTEVAAFRDWINKHAELA